MPDHPIHLRRAWDAEGGPSPRVDLPATWGPGPLPRRLARSFQGPRLDASREHLFLRFESMTGLRSATLNGADLGDVTASAEAREVAVPSWLSSGNRLVLELDADATPRGVEWGRVTLVIRS